ncbi:hypothetical protein BU15DRAFT_74200, partial [Melanogaster broomeanus]
MPSDDPSFTATTLRPRSHPTRDCPTKALSDPLLLLQSILLSISFDELEEPPLFDESRPEPLSPLASTTMNRRRAPRRTPTARPQSDNPMNLPRARRFLPRNDLPSNRDDLFELVVQTTTSALMQNLRIEELIPILRQLRNCRAQDISTVLADVTQLLERDLLALVGLSEAITRIPMTSPTAQPTTKTLTMKGPLVLVLPVLHSFAPAHVSSASPLDTFASTVVGTNVPYVTPLVRDTSPNYALFVPPKNPL